MVTIIDPHIKRDPAYYIYQEAEKGSYFVKDKDGKDKPFLKAITFTPPTAAAR